MKYDVTVFGCAASVCILKVKTLPEAGKTVWVLNSNAEVFNGGVGFNISCGLSALGLKVYPVLSYPDERLGKLLLEDFSKRFHWPVDGLDPPMKGDYRTCYIFQDGNRNHMTFMYGYGENADQEYADKPIEIREAFFKDSRMVVLASPRPVNTEPIFRALQKHETPYAFSYRNDKIIFPAPILKEILLGASILFMNEAEAELIVNQYSLNDISDLFKLGRASVITVTYGKGGCCVYSKNGASCGKIHVPVTENEVGNVDAVGAGDSFLSGFMYGYLNGKSVETCAQYGSTVSSFVIEKEGSTTNLPTAEMMLMRNRTRPDAWER